MLPGLDPDLKARLFAAFDLQILWNKPGRQATVHAEITEATLRALPALLNPGQDGYDDTADIASGETADVEDLFETPTAAKCSTGAGSSTKRARHSYHGTLMHHGTIATTATRHSGYVYNPVACLNSLALWAVPNG